MVDALLKRGGDCRSPVDSCSGAGYGLMDHKRSNRLCVVVCNDDYGSKISKSIRQGRDRTSTLAVRESCWTKSSLPNNPRIVGRLEPSEPEGTVVNFSGNFYSRETLAVTYPAIFNLAVLEVEISGIFTRRDLEQPGFRVVQKYLQQKGERVFTKSSRQ
ncbi:MAG TPA: hypothetical protein VHH35_04140 [Pyrinomonadaceae bacterium]|nr:hypothetical protein [Pyrinomonadaceae bacterium]